jgi:hypothetical protein
MPSETGQLRFRLRFPDNTRIGPFPAQTMIDLYSGGGVPEGAFVRRDPDGAWLPFHTAFRNILPRKTSTEKKTVRDRRLNSEFTIIDRRRGKGRMFSQIALCASLFIGLVFVLR